MHPPCGEFPEGDSMRIFAAEYCFPPPRERNSGLAERPQMFVLWTPEGGPIFLPPPERIPNRGSFVRVHQTRARPAMSDATATASTAAAVTPEAMLEHWQGHRRLTRRMIEAYPEDQLFSFALG